MKKVYRLKTTVDLFLEWLEQRLSPLHGKRIRLGENTWSSLQRVRKSAPYQPIYALEGTLEWRESDGRHMMDLRTWEVVRFQIEELAPQRVRVAIEPSNVPEAEAIAEYLHRAILEDYGLESSSCAEKTQVEAPSGEAEDSLSSTDKKTGPRAGTLERVREAHRLLKQAEREGKSRTWAFRQARTDPRTYYRWCKKATGEPPLLME